MIFYAVIIILFYFLEVLQHTFFVHFNFFGAVPNLVFALFFTLVFFEGKDYFYKIIFYSITAGFIYDIFSYSYFGASILLLLAIGFATKEIQKLLKNTNDNFPFIYFLPLFIVFLILYDVLLAWFKIGFSVGFFAGIFYSLAFASVFFWIYKKYIFPRLNNRQLSLFK